MQQTKISNTADLGVAMRKVRKELGLTQEELSLQTGISRPTIRGIEKGKETAHIGLVFKLCEDLGISIILDPPEQEVDL